MELQKDKILDPKTVAKKCTIARVVASCALFEILLYLLVPLGLVLALFWGDFCAMLNRFWKVFGLIFDALGRFFVSTLEGFCNSF